MFSFLDFYAISNFTHIYFMEIPQGNMGKTTIKSMWQLMIVSQKDKMPKHRLEINSTV